MSVVKMTGSVIGSAILLGGIAVAPALAESPVDVEPTADCSMWEESSKQSESAAAIAQGEFSYTQDAITANEAIRGVFAKASSAVCASLPAYDLSHMGLKTIVKNGSAEMIACIEDMLDGKPSTKIVGCACSSDIAGGGAVANAEVSGMSIKSMAVMMGVE